MEPRQPRVHRQQQLRVRVATPAYLVVEVEGVPYYVRCLPNRHNPPTGRPIRPGDVLRVYNTPGPQGPTLVERFTPAGAGDGCTYLLRDYDRADPASNGAAQPRGAAGRESRRAMPGSRRGARRQ
jgi:hypothetical protein